MVGGRERTEREERTRFEGLRETELVNERREGRASPSKGEEGSAVRGSATPRCVSIAEQASDEVASGCGTRKER